MMDPIAPPTLLWECTTHGADATHALGRRLGEACQGGEIILLDGPLGAGKTCLAGGVAEGLGVIEPAVSPTFVIMRAYRGARGLALHHFDLYRLGGDDDLDTIGWDDALAPDAVVLVEWPARCPSVLEEYTVALKLEPTGDGGRRITAHAGARPGAGRFGTRDLCPSDDHDTGSRP